MPNIDISRQHFQIFYFSEKKTGIGISRKLPPIKKKIMLSANVAISIYKNKVYKVTGLFYNFKYNKQIPWGIYVPRLIFI